MKTDALEALDWIITNGVFKEEDTDALTDNTNKIRKVIQPEKIEGLDEALLCGKHPDQARKFKEKYGAAYWEVTQKAAKAYADLTGDD